MVKDVCLLIYYCEHIIWVTSIYFISRTLPNDLIWIFCWSWTFPQFWNQYTTQGSLSKKKSTKAIQRNNEVQDINVNVICSCINRKEIKSSRKIRKQKKKYSWIILKEIKRIQLKPLLKTDNQQWLVRLIDKVCEQWSYNKMVEAEIFKFVRYKHAVIIFILF